MDNDPIYIIMELMPAGDLLKFLRDAKRDHVSWREGEGGTSHRGREEH